jgi:hypothetical protein
METLLEIKTQASDLPDDCLFLLQLQEDLSRVKGNSKCGLYQIDSDNEFY